jgi:hypothetical protein
VAARGVQESDNDKNGQEKSHTSRVRGVDERKALHRESDEGRVLGINEWTSDEVLATR